MNSNLSLHCYQCHNICIIQETFPECKGFFYFFLNILPLLFFPGPQKPGLFRNRTPCQQKNPGAGDLLLPQRRPFRDSIIFFLSQRISE